MIEGGTKETETKRDMQTGGSRGRYK
jgi:hypothetical protein